MNVFNYNVDLTGLNIVMTNDEQNQLFFVHGHPQFLIPDFFGSPGDIWTTYLDYLERKWDCEVYDQDGGEVTMHEIINTNTGLTKCTYQAYGICMYEDSEPTDFIVDIEGYIIREGQSAYFLATKVVEDSF